MECLYGGKTLVVDKHFYKMSRRLKWKEQIADARFPKCSSRRMLRGMTLSFLGLFFSFALNLSGLRGTDVYLGQKWFAEMSASDYKQCL